MSKRTWTQIKQIFWELYVCTGLLLQCILLRACAHSLLPTSHTGGEKKKRKDHSETADRTHTAVGLSLGAILAQRHHRASSSHLLEQVMEWKDKMALFWRAEAKGPVVRVCSVATGAFSSLGEESLAKGEPCLLCRKRRKGSLEPPGRREKDIFSTNPSLFALCFLPTNTHQQFHLDQKLIGLVGSILWVFQPWKKVCHLWVCST